MHHLALRKCFGICRHATNSRQLCSACIPSTTFIPATTKPTIAMTNYTYAPTGDKVFRLPRTSLALLRSSSGVCGNSTTTTTTLHSGQWQYLTGKADALACRLCWEEESSLDHLLLRCPIFMLERYNHQLGANLDELTIRSDAALAHLIIIIRLFGRIITKTTAGLHHHVTHMLQEGYHTPATFFPHLKPCLLSICRYTIRQHWLIASVA